MKIIKPGALGDDGIYITCQYCHAEFIAEDRNDLVANIVKYYDYEEQKVITVKDYSIYCPCCGEQYYLGVDPKIAKCTINNKAEFMRKDWDERFSHDTSN